MWAIRAYKTTAIIVLNLVLLLLLMEGLAALYGYRKPSSVNQTPLGFDYAPYRMMKTNVAPWPLNEDGFRAKPMSQYARSSGERFQIVFLGGSVCVGYAQKIGDTLSDLLELELKKRGLDKVDVINLCQGGASSAQELAIFIQYGLSLKPEIVVSFNGANDIFHVKPLGPDEQPNLPYMNKEMRALWLHNPGSYGSVLSHTALGRLATRVAMKYGLKDSGGTDVPVKSVTSSYIEMMNITSSLAKSYGGHHAILVQPTVFVDKVITPEEQAVLRKYHPGYIQAESRAKESYISLLSALSLSSTAQGRIVFDLTNTFRHASETIYMDSVHFADAGKGYPALLGEMKRQGFVDWVVRQYNTRQHKQGALPGVDKRVTHFKKWAPCLSANVSSYYLSPTAQQGILENLNEG